MTITWLTGRPFFWPGASIVGSYSVWFLPPAGYVFAPRDQGTDNAVDSDADPTTGETPVFTVLGAESYTRWDAGMVPPCDPPDEAIYVSGMRLSTDGNDYTILDFQDPNQPVQRTGHNVYSSSDPAPPPSSWPLLDSESVRRQTVTLGGVSAS